jgi:hypothetical protein
MDFFILCMGLLVTIRVLEHHEDKIFSPLSSLCKTLEDWKPTNQGLHMLSRVLLFPGPEINAAFRALGPGYCRGESILPGHRTALLIFLYFLIIFYTMGFVFAPQETRGFDTQLVSKSASDGSTLVLVLLGVQFGIGILTALTFYFDRYRIPVFLLLILLITGASLLNNPESTFYARPVEPLKVVSLLSPREILAKSPARVVVVAAAGGGIQSSGWTAQVLAGLTEENATFREHLKVISGVSGGSVGTVFYLASYKDVWSPQA